MTISSSRPDEFEFHFGRGWLTSERSMVKYVNQNDANGYYEALGISPRSGKEEIRAAYLKLAKRLHPDMFDGDEELFRFVSDVASVLLDSKAKMEYDSVGDGFLYLGRMESEELARRGMLQKFQVGDRDQKDHWACLTDRGFLPGRDTEAWIDFCWEVSPAVGYRGKIRVGVVEGGHSWPCDSHLLWGIISTGVYTFVVFQRGVEPNRLHALCAMIDLQKHLKNQIQ